MISSMLCQIFTLLQKAAFEIKTGACVSLGVETRLEAPNLFDGGQADLQPQTLDQRSDEPLFYGAPKLQFTGAYLSCQAGINVLSLMCGRLVCMLGRPALGAGNVQILASQGKTA